MKKFFIILSGVYIIIAGILIAAPSFSFLNESRDNLPIVIAGFLSLLIPGVLMVLTGIGIMRRKNWARYSLFVMSIFSIFTGLLTSLIVALVPQGQLSNRPIFSVVFLIFLIFLVAIPVCFLIFFTRRSVKEQFVSKEQELKKSPRPLGIKLIAILTFIGAISSLIQVLFPPIQKLPIFGFLLLSGVSLRIYLLIFAAIGFYIAFGLWRLKKGGWIAYVILYIYGILAGLIHTLTISEATLLEIMPKMKDAVPQMPIMFYKICGLAGILISVLLLIYIFSKKKLFFKTDNAQNVPK